MSSTIYSRAPERVASDLGCVYADPFVVTAWMKSEELLAKARRGIAPTDDEIGELRDAITHIATLAYVLERDSAHADERRKA